MSEIHPDMPLILTRKAGHSQLLLVWDLRYESGWYATYHRTAENVALADHPSSWDGPYGKVPFYFKWLNYSKAA